MQPREIVDFLVPDETAIADQADLHADAISERTTQFFIEDAGHIQATLRGTTHLRRCTEHRVRRIRRSDEKALALLCTGRGNFDPRQCDTGLGHECRTFEDRTGSNRVAVAGASQVGSDRR